MCRPCSWRWADETRKAKVEASKHDPACGTDTVQENICEACDIPPSTRGETTYEMRIRIQQLLEANTAEVERRRKVERNVKAYQELCKGLVHFIERAQEEGEED